MSTFRAAAIQMRSGTDVVRNVETLEKFVAEAASKGAAYVQSPEMTGAMMRDRVAFKASLRDEANDLVFKAASALAAKHGIFLHIGSTAIDTGDGKIANRAGIFTPSGEKLATYDKIHMFDVDLDNGESWRESATYEPGRGNHYCRTAFCQSRHGDLLRYPFSAIVPRAGACRCQCDYRPRGLYEADR